MSNIFTHWRIRKLLYEYVRNELPPERAKAVADHLANCRRCFTEVDELRDVLLVLPGKEADPASERPVEFWNAFADRVQAQIDRPQIRKKTTLGEEWDLLLSNLVARQRWIIGLSGAVAVAVATLILYRPAQTPVVTPLQTKAEPTVRSEGDIAEVRARAGDYFRKSRTLLVGISNMKVGTDMPVDLSAEQRLSRQLVHEAGYLKQQPLDLRSARVVGDVEKVLVALANLQKDRQLPDVELIRSGIHQENLLFKIRMAESVFDSSVHTARATVPPGR
jgi:hypothetical protein